MIDCYISQIQTPSPRVSLSMFAFSSPAFFSFQVHKRPVYVQLEILFHPYCLISFQNPSAQYHFCHIVSPPRHFWKRHPVLELGAVLGVLSEPNNKLTVMQKLSHGPAGVQSFLTCFDLVCLLFLLCSCFVFIIRR